MVALMTNGVMVVINLRYFTEFGSFGPMMSVVKLRPTPTRKRKFDLYKLRGHLDNG